MQRVSNGDDLRKLMLETESLKEVRIDLNDWLADDRNVAIENNGDYGVFEYDGPGQYLGHYFFRSRGKTARDNAKAILQDFFDNYPVQVIIGLTPMDHYGALWMNRQLGLKQYDIVETPYGPHALVILTRQEYRNKE